MSRLIQMRQRIKAIETTKKVTRAMRLISMSSHTRLHSKNEPLKQYKLATKHLFHRIRSDAPEWQHPMVQPASTKTPKQLIILIGSQKGLCGNFNSALFKFFKLKTTPELLKNTDVITIGKKATDFIAAETHATIIAHYDFNAITLLRIAHELTEMIIEKSQQYSTAFIFSNEILSFFAQKPRRMQIIPFVEEKNNRGENQTVKRRIRMGTISARHSGFFAPTNH